MTTLPENSYKILVLDDEPPILGAIKRAFFDEEWETYTTNNVDEALDLIYENDFAVVLSDYKMPDMTGVEFLSEVKKLSPDTIRMIISGYAEAHAIVEAINQGQIFRFIPKPWNNTELVKIVKQGIDYYALTMRNKELEARLLAKNAELAAINEDLEQRVQERTWELLAHNQALTFVQDVLDELPYSIMGVDPEGLIVLVNKRASSLFGDTLIGIDAELVLAPDYIELMWNTIDKKSPYKGTKKLNNKDFILEIVPIKNNISGELRGISIILREKD